MQILLSSAGKIFLEFASLWLDVKKIVRKKIKIRGSQKQAKITQSHLRDNKKQKQKPNFCNTKNKAALYMLAAGEFANSWTRRKEENIANSDYILLPSAAGSHHPIPLCRHRAESQCGTRGHHAGQRGPSAARCVPLGTPQTVVVRLHYSTRVADHLWNGWEHQTWQFWEWYNDEVGVAVMKGIPKTELALKCILLNKILL